MIKYILLSLVLFLSACNQSAESIAPGPADVAKMEARISAALTSNSSKTIEEKLKHMPEGTPGREKVVVRLTEVKKSEEADAEKGRIAAAAAQKKQEAVVRGHYTALNGEVDSKNGIVSFRGYGITADNIKGHFQKLIDALISKYGASEIEVQYQEPDGLSVYKYPTLAISVIFIGDTGKDSKIGREIARSIYVFSYPAIKKAVWLDVWNKPQRDWNEKFSYSYMILPGTNPDEPKDYLFSRDQNALMKDPRWVK